MYRKRKKTEIIMAIFHLSGRQTTLIIQNREVKLKLPDKNFPILLSLSPNNMEYYKVNGMGWCFIVKDIYHKIIPFSTPWVATAINGFFYSGKKYF